MNSAVATVLNKVLGDWIEDLNPNDLNLSILSGNVTLTNLRVKGEALNKFGLPVEVKSGYIGRMVASIPWASLNSSPLRIEISNVTVFLKPRPLDTWDSEVQKKNLIEGKLSSLEDFELINQKDFAEAKDPGFFGRLVENIVDNIQISVKNVYVRLEDNVASTYKFALGVRIGSVKTYTTDSNWNEDFVSGSKVTYRIASLEDFAVYMDYEEDYILSCEEKYPGTIADSIAKLAYDDFKGLLQHRYILRPLQLGLQLTMNKNIKDLSQPQIKAAISTSDIQFEILMNQIVNVFKVLDFLSYFDQFKKGVLTEMSERNLVNEEAEVYRDIYKNWLVANSGTDSKSKANADSLKNRLKPLDTIYLYSDILNNRRRARVELELEVEEKQKREEIKKISEEPKQGTMGKLKGFFFGKKESEKQREDEERKRKIEEEEEKLNEIIRKKQSFQENFMTFLTEDNTAPDSYVKILINVEIRCFSIYLANGNFGITKFTMDQLTGSFGMRANTVYVKGKIENIHMIDLIVKSPIFPFILKTGYIDFEFDQAHRNRFKLRTGDSISVLNPDFTMKMIACFDEAIAQKVDLSAYAQIVSKATASYASMGLDYLRDLSKTGIETSLELDILIKAPDIFVPLDINSLDKPMLVLDLGDFKASNVQEVISGLNYDTYLAKLEDMRLISVWKCDSFDTWEFGEIETLLSPLTLDISFSNCKLRNQKASPGFILKANIGMLDLNINDKEVLFVIELIDHIMGLKEKILPNKEPSEPQIKAIEDTTAEQKLQEAASLKEGLKDFGDFLSTRIEVSVSGINLNLFHNDTHLLSLVINQIKTSLSVTSKPSIDLDFSLHKIELLDKREGVAYDRIIYNPSMYYDVDEESQDESQIYQVSGSLKVKPAEDLLDLSASLSDLRIIASTEFIAALLNSVRNVMNKIERYEELKRLKGREEEISRPITSQLAITQYKRFMVKLNNFEVVFPINVRDINIEVMTLHFGVNASYIMSEKSIKYYDSEYNTVKVDYIQADNEGSLEINHLGISIGAIREEDIKQPQKGSNDLMNPSRIILKYKNIKQMDQNILRTILDTNLESIGLTIGFRDIHYILELSKVWTAVNFQFDTQETVKTEAPVMKPKQNPGRIDFTMVCDSLQINLVEDTELKPYNLFNAEFSNLSSVFQLGDSNMNFSYSTILNSNYYNLYNASWEPFIENWTFSITGIQKSNTEPFELIVNSGQLFNINLTYSMAETIAKVLSKLDFSQPDSPIKHGVVKKAVSSTHELSDHSEFIYSIHNKLGIPITIWLEVSKDVKKSLIDPDQHIIWSQEYINRVYAHDRLESKNSSVYNMIQAPTCLSLKAAGYKEFKGLAFESMYTTGFVIEGENSQEIQCALSFSAQGNHRHVYIQSGFVVMNNADFPIDIEWNSEILKVQGNSSDSLPLPWVTSTIQPFIRTLSEAKVSLKENRVLHLENGFLILEVHEYRTSSNILQTIYQFNPALSISNLSPALLRVYTDSSLGNFIELEPGNEKCITHLNPIEKYSMKFTLVLPGDQEITSEFVNIKKPKEYIRMTGPFPCDDITLDYEPKVFKRNSTLDLRFRAKYIEEAQSEPDSQAKSMQITLYPQFIINNHTDFQLSCGKNIKLLLNPHSLGFYNSKQAKLSIRLLKKNQEEFKSQWSNEFNVNTVGVSGLVSLSCSDSSNASNVQLGARIQAAPAPLIKSSIIHIVPRFIVLNHLGFPIQVRQYIPDRPSSNKVVLGDSESVAYQLDDFNLSKSIQVSADGTHWSSPFDIEKFEDFQIRFPGLPDQYIPEYEYKGLEVLKKLLGKNIKNDWYKPQRLNNYTHFARVCVISEDEATIFINLVSPKDPEFVVWNMTDSPLTVRQLECSPQVIPPKTRVPWCFDNYSANDRRLELKSGTYTEVFSIEKLKQKKHLGDNKVDVVVNGVTREMKIIPLHYQQPNIDFSFMKFLLEHVKPVNREVKLLVNMGGIGLSVVDDTPVEKFYLAIIGIDIKLKAKDTVLGSTTNTELSFDLKVNHLQLDNMDIKGKLFPVMFVTRDLDQDEPTPFLQIKIKRNSSKLHTTQNGKRISITSMDRWVWFEVQLQEMKISINQDVIYDILNLLNKLTDVFKQTGLVIEKESSKALAFEEISSDLIAAYPQQKLDPLSVSKKAYFEFIHLGAIKVVITFRSSKQSIEFELNPLMAFGVLRVVMNLGRSLADISDSPLYFSEIFMRHSFQTLDTIVSVMIKNFIRQGIMQFYKVIGSSDILGNPIGLVDKLGTGVFEFLNEPRKGALKGPKGFVEGVGKGVKSLVGNVISAGFGSVGKITGSLYNVLNEVRRDEETEELKESDNVIGGVVQGFKGGATDIASGLKGIFTKPWRGAKKGGFKGLAKGIGSGLIGAVTAPVAAVLRVGNSIATGVANTGVLIAKGKVKPQGRQRFPRQFGARKILEPYNSELAQAQELLKTMGEHSNESMVYYTHIIEEKDIIIILTTLHILKLVDGELTEDIPVQDITACEVHKVNEEYVLLIRADKKKADIKSWNYSKLAKMYSALMSLPTSIKKSSRLEEIRIQDRGGRGCCGS